DGFGKSAEVPGYFIGGKTGTAEKSGRGGYRKKANVQAFMSVFPMNAPRYAVYFMLDEAKANASTFGYATAGWVAAPGAGRVVARIGPMLGLLPETTNIPAIAASLAIPLVPARPAGAAATPAAPPPTPGRPAAPRPQAGSHPGAHPSTPKTTTIPAAPPRAPAAPAPPVRDPRREAAATPQAGGRIVAVR
ncbi:MAG: penicillin-binding protein 2, partial [Acetobacteraceae bacterium]|nr:penicillin-binding protein 2 [Acetobacteraceae bacterium]